MNDLEDALYDALIGNTALMAKATGVYNTVAPRSATCPFVVFGHQAGTDAYTARLRSTREYIYQVKCIAEGASSKVAGDVYGLIDAVLFDATLTAGSKAVLYVRRESDVKYSETVEGKQYWHVGALYRIVVAG